MTNTATITARPAVLDSKDQPLELRMRVKLLGANDKDENGKARFGTIVNLEHQRSRVVIAIDGIEKLAVRKSEAVMIRKTRSGKIERVEAPARKARAARELVSA